VALLLLAQVQGLSTCWNNCYYISWHQNKIQVDTCYRPEKLLLQQHGYT